MNRRAFTLIELLVAIGITSIMLVIINQIMYSATELVGTGAAVSDMIGNGRTIDEQIRQDMRRLIGPDTLADRGLLLIVNRKIPNVRVVTDKGETVRDFVRSDQLVFIADASGIQPLCPANVNSFSNGASAQYMRVWYGHPLRINPNGSNDVGAIIGGPQNGNRNLLASDWILGRQALLLCGQQYNGTSWNPPSPVYANGAVYNATVNGYGAGKTLAGGYSDVSNTRLETAAGDPSTYIIESVVQSSMTGSQYATATLNLAFDTERLQVNPTPDGATFDSWKIAQMHPMVAGHVSDFIVEFTGDYVAESPINKVPDVTSGTDNMVWYNTFTDWPDTAVPPAAVFTGNGTAPYHGNGVTVFRHDDTSYWPSLLRIRYRIHDRKGRIFGGGKDPGDANDPGNGRWFEMVVAVPK